MLVFIRIVNVIYLYFEGQRFESGIFSHNVICRPKQQVLTLYGEMNACKTKSVKLQMYLENRKMYVFMSQIMDAKLV